MCAFTSAHVTSICRHEDADKSSENERTYKHVWSSTPRADTCILICADGEFHRQKVTSTYTSKRTYTHVNMNTYACTYSNFWRRNVSEALVHRSRQNLSCTVASRGVDASRVKHTVCVFKVFVCVCVSPFNVCVCSRVLCVCVCVCSRSVQRTINNQL